MPETQNTNTPWTGSPNLQPNGPAPVDPSTLTPEQMVEQASQQSEEQNFANVASVYTWDSPAITPITTAVTPQQVSNDELIDTATGQLGATPEVQTQTAQATQAQTPQEIQAAIIEAAKSGDNIDALLQQYQYASGQVAPESTVQGQLNTIMQQFQNGNAPPWAAAALRQANTAMAQRGISSSSMAGQAVVQAALEAALPIAQQDAQTNFQMQMANLSNEQQMLVQRNQARTEGFLSDIATENATRQFNASSQNQVAQFNQNLRAQVEQFNTSQTNALAEFNAGQTNAVSMFRAQMQDSREQFNAANRLVIDQANANWRRQVSTQNNATINEANRIDASNLLATTMAEFNNISQSRRDAINFAFTASENAADRAVQLMLATMSAEEAQAARSSASSRSAWSAVGSVAARIFTGFFS